MLVRAILPTLIVLIPCLINFLSDPDRYSRFSYLLGILVILTFLHAFFIQYRPHLKIKNEYVDLVAQSFFSNILYSIKTTTPKFRRVDVNKLPFRINIMKPKFNMNPFMRKKNFLKTCLFVRHHCNMQGHQDLNIILNPGRGVAGKAYKENKPKIGNTALMSRSGAYDWDLTPEEKMLTKGIKSIISIPIMHNKNKNKVLGVLSIDTTEKIGHTPFKDTKFRNALEETSKMFYGTIM